jgi:hypothetical protein
LNNAGTWQAALQAYGDALFLQMCQKCTIQANGRLPFRHMEMHYFFKCVKNAQYRQMADCPYSIWRCTLSSYVSKMHNTGKWQAALQAYGDALFLQMYQKCTIQANGRQPFRHMETLVHCGPRLCAKNTHRCDIGDALCIMYYVICTINDK